MEGFNRLLSILTLVWSESAGQQPSAGVSAITDADRVLW